MEKIDLIKSKYSRLNNKMDFIMKVSQKAGLNMFTVKNHHFGNKWAIPKKYHAMYLKELESELKKQ